MSQNPGPVPDRWMHCPRKADELIESKFFAFKTPLSKRFDKQVPPKYRFHPKMVFSTAKLKKIKIGLWIDLTNSDRFYDRREVEEHNCRYVKIACRGHGQTPSQAQTKEFIETVGLHIQRNPLDVIAVHCTHGFNRTGFLIVSFLVEDSDSSLDIALKQFENARYPGIYKSDYIEELYKRYYTDEAPPDYIIPSLPDWCFQENVAEEESNPLDDDIEEEASSSSSRSEHKKKSKKVAQFMEGVPGVTSITEQPLVSNLQKKVVAMCRMRKKEFPGSQPVSMQRTNIELLSQKPYMVSWKADGMRYLMLIDGRNQNYFFDRDFNVFLIHGLKFPTRQNLHDDITNTLIDGEMVIDKVNGEHIPRFLAYDIIIFSHTNIGDCPFQPTRLQCLESEIIKPRYAAMEAGIINKADEPFSIRKKDFWDVTVAKSLLGEKFARTLSHEPDGLIFQPSLDPYKPGTCQDVLKWKPPSLNSIDFKMKIERVGGEGKITKLVCNLYVGQNHIPISSMKYKNDLKQYDNKIIECKYEDGQWKFMRERTDKSFPNSEKTAMSVWKSITEPVTKEYLLDYIEKSVRNDRIKMPPPKKQKYV